VPEGALTLARTDDRDRTRLEETLQTTWQGRFDDVTGDESRLGVGTEVD
jgi:hypothetical protein